jgi:hypothetical protein
MNEERKGASSKTEFLRWAGIGPELADFLTEFVQKPEEFYSMSFERRREIENQMDSVIASLKKW